MHTRNQRSIDQMALTIGGFFQINLDRMTRAQVIHRSGIDKYRQRHRHRHRHKHRHVHIPFVLNGSLSFSLVSCSLCFFPSLFLSLSSNHLSLSYPFLGLHFSLSLWSLSLCLFQVSIYLYIYIYLSHALQSLFFSLSLQFLSFSSHDNTQKAVLEQKGAHCLWIPSTSRPKMHAHTLARYLKRKNTIMQASTRIHGFPRTALIMCHQWRQWHRHTLLIRHDV